jgi:hypothetical protein
MNNITLPIKMTSNVLEYVLSSLVQTESFTELHCWSLNGCLIQTPTGPALLSPLEMISGGSSGYSDARSRSTQVCPFPFLKIPSLPQTQLMPHFMGIPRYCPSLSFLLTMGNVKSTKVILSIHHL